MSNEEIIERLDKMAQHHEICGQTFAPDFPREKYQAWGQTLREAIALLRTHPDAQPNEPQGDGWISVEDKDNPPPEAEKVMAYLKFRHGDLRETAYYMGEDGWYYTGVEAPHHGVVTHWRPLPEPPKEEHHEETP